MTTHRKRRILTLHARAGDVLAGEWARTLTGQLYYIKSISEGHALGWDTRRPGHYDILPVRLLVPVEP